MTKQIDFKSQEKIKLSKIKENPDEIKNNPTMRIISQERFK